MFIKYVGTKEQIADIFTKGAFTAESWNSLCDLAQIGDPTRLTIALALNAGGQMCGCDIAWIVGQSQKLVSHHLRKLKAADAVTSNRDGKLVMYSLTDRGARLLSILTEPLATASATADLTGVDHG